MKCAGHVPRVEEMGSACQNLIGKPEETTLRYGHGCEDNIEVNLKFGGRVWIGHIAHDYDRLQRLVSTVMNVGFRSRWGRGIS